MSKRIIALIFVTLFCASLVIFKISNMASKNHLENKKGLNIDIARHPLSERDLKLIIKTAKQKNLIIYNCILVIMNISLFSLII
ncbi:hypothetical protein WKK_01890 [Weissella koreensis KACC 15510]|nr:hypothetical protein WKK_01890 [Weissella koreensis KACC 15510]